jgi:two-component system, NtrC family, response regulator AtoC
VALCVVVEDQDLQRRTLAVTLQAARYQVLEARTGSAALDVIAMHLPEAVLLDLGLPDVDGLDLVPRILQVSPMSRIVVLTGRNSVAESVSALRAGARHYLVKPYDREELLVVLEREIAAVNLEVVHDRERRANVFWGADPAMSSIDSRLDRLAESPWTPVLVHGETGTGKEVVARELHRRSQVGGAFVAINCAAVPAGLMESELFGHERGAFTGAGVRRRGAVELAEGGTLFLDEVGEMELRLQAKLLRFLQDGSFRRLGSENEMSSRTRVVAATNRSLGELEASERFRPDLFYRLAVVPLAVPPLRDRAGDLLPLTRFLLERIASDLGRPPRPLSPRAEKAVCRHPWPGNVRELGNRLERALVLGTEGIIEPEDLDLPRDEAGAAVGASVILPDPARLRRLLEEEGWNLAAVARRLGIPRHRVKYRVARLGLRRPTGVEKN